MPSFEFADCPTKISLTVATDTQAQSGTLTSTIRNVTARRQTGRIRVEPLGAAKADWFTLADAPPTSPREIEQDFAAKGTLTIRVQVKVPPRTPPGSQTFRLRVTSESAPDTDFAEGPAVAMDVVPFVEPPAPKKAGLPWWAFAVAGLFIVMVVGAVTWLVWPAKLDPKLVVGKPLVEARRIALAHGFKDVKVEPGDAWGNAPAAGVVVGVAPGPTLQTDQGVTLPPDIIGRPLAEAIQIMLDRGVFPVVILGQVNPGQRPGMVYATQPPPGAPVPLGTAAVINVFANDPTPAFPPGIILPCVGLPSRCGMPQLKTYTVDDMNAVARDRIKNKARMVDIILGNK